MANPYNLEFLTQLLEQPESQRLEFKSSRELLNENSQKRAKFISDQLVPAVSAFLNTDGGQLVVGIEEKPVRLSDGVPPSRISWEQLQSQIINRIQPAVAGYVSVFSVPTSETSEGEKLFAFVVDVKAGTTAYQADDKKYYVRRSGQSEAMEDKDIRLRMLAGDKPRLAISLRSRLILRSPLFTKLVQSVEEPVEVSSVQWVLGFENVGVRNIPRAIIRSNLTFQGLSENGAGIVSAKTREYDETNFPFSGLESTGLLPGRPFELPYFDANSLMFWDCPDPTAVTMLADVTVYVDDGLPAELTGYDLMADLRPVIANKWTMPKE
jgi:hypothetical protein